MRFGQLCCFWITALFLLSPDLQAQPQAYLKPTTLPKIHFSFDHPDLFVVHYELEIDADGNAHYESRNKGEVNGTSEQEIARDFNISAATRDRIFDLVKAAHNLNGEFAYTRHKVAFTGTKTILYTDSRGTNTAKFIWSENEPVMQLTELLQGISATLEEGPVLQRLRRYDPLGLNAELGKMEKLADSGWLSEINLIADTLKEIANDSSVMGLARKRAEHLLRKAVPPNNET